MHSNLEDDDNTASMSDWGGSLTPPLSDDESDMLLSQCVAPQRKDIPHEHDILLDNCDVIPTFRCKEPGSGFTNLTRLDIIQRIMDNIDPYSSCTCFEGSSVRLFGWKFPTEQGLYQSYRRKLFLLCRQSIFRLKAVEMTTGILKNDQFCKTVKASCVDFMAYLHYLVNRITSSQRSLPAIGEYSNAIDAAMREIDLLLIAIGRIQIKSPLKNIGNVATPSITKADIMELINHIILEINWFYLAMLMELCLCGGIDNEKKATYIAKFENHCTKVIWDMVSIAGRVFKRRTNVVLSRQYGSQSPLFPCTCCIEMTLSVMTMSDEVSFRENSQGFWSLFTGVCSNLQAVSDKSVQNDNTENLAPDDVSFDTPVTFCWWLVKEIAPLYKYDIAGRLVHKEGMFLPSNWLLVHDLLRETFNLKELDTDEEFARQSLRSCIDLARIWTPKSDVITYLWEYFHKKLNTRFLVGNQGVLNVAVPSLTALQLVEKFNFFKHGDQPERDTLEHSTSFELFLLLLAISLQKTAKNDDQSNLWGQLKGRFYSKFHKKRMEEFNDTGLSNFVSLFLVLASCVQTENMVEKFPSFLNLIQLEKISQSMSMVMIKGLYAMLHVQWRLNLCAPALTEKLRWHFDYICRSFTQRQHDQMTKRNSWQLICLHFDCLEDLFDNSDAAGKEVPFLSVGDTLSNVFSKCNDSEARRISSFVYRLLSSIKMQNTTMNASDSFVWSGLYTWMQKSFLDKQLINRIPESIADPAAGFTLLSIYRAEESNLVPTFHEMVTRHTASELPSRFVAKYLSHLLSSSAAVDRIVADDLQWLVIQTWLRCLISLTEKNQIVSEISRHVLLLPEVKQLVDGEAEDANHETDNTVFACIIAFGKRQSSISQLSEMAELRQRAKSFFGSILRNTGNLLSTGEPIDSLRLLYSIVGKLVKHCSKLIYSKTSPDCLLPKILDQMVLPHQSSKWTTPLSLHNCLCGYIHQFLQGLSALDFKKDEFIRRKIREIFSRYFLFIIKRCHASPTSKNPFLVALQATFGQEVPSHASDFRQFVIDIISESFLVLPQPPDNHSAVLYFIMRLFQKSHDNSEIVRNSPSIIMQIICSLISCDACGGANAEPPGIRHPAMEILTMITKAHKSASRDERTKLREKLQTIMLLNIHQFQGIVFKSFEAVAKLDKDLGRELLQTAIEAVEDNEKRRGCGRDTRLRNSLETFIACVDS